jgi:hypothetical protein
MSAIQLSSDESRELEEVRNGHESDPVTFFSRNQTSSFRTETNGRVVSLVPHNFDHHPRWRWYNEETSAACGKRFPLPADEQT